jgi:hypothetical protein
MTATIAEGRADPTVSAVSRKRTWIWLLGYTATPKGRSRAIKWQPIVLGWNFVVWDTDP